MADRMATRPGKYAPHPPEAVYQELALLLAEQGVRIDAATPSSVAGTVVDRRQGSCLVMVVSFALGVIPGLYYLWWLNHTDEHSFVITLSPSGDGTVMHGNGTLRGLAAAHWATDQVAG